MVNLKWIMIGFSISVVSGLAYHIFDRRNLRLYIKPSLEQLYNDVTQVLDRYQIPYFLDYGTLLGYFREGELLDHDIDVDISVHSEYQSVLLEALQNLPESYYIRTPPKGDFLKWKRTNIKIKRRRRLGSLDIYLYYPFELDTICQGKACRFNKEKVISCVPVGDYSQLPTDWFFPLKQSELVIGGEKRKCYIPNQTKAYIRHLYGDNSCSDMVGLFGNSLFIRRFWRRATDGR
jgi:hypothetical protein